MTRPHSAPRRPARARRATPSFVAAAPKVAPLAALLAGLLSGQALAQTAAQPGSTEADAAVLPVVRVKVSTKVDSTEGTGSYTSGASQSATGLSLSLRDTPQSVTMITRERMQDQAMASVSDAILYTTGLSLKATDRGRVGLSSRGFDITNFQFDGVPVTTSNIGGEISSMVIYDRIEVVRGATGLLAGAGNPSAAINLVRKRASSKIFTGTLEATLGSDQHRGLSADLSTPLTEDGRVRARVAVGTHRQDAHIDLENTKRNVFYGVIDADLGPQTQLRVGASSQTDKRNGVYWGGLTYWYSDGTRTDWDRSKTTATRWNQWDTTQQTAFAGLSHRLDNGWRLRADLNHYKQKEESLLLWATGFPDRVTGQGMNAQTYHYRSRPTQDQVSLSASGPFSLWGREHELLLGLSHSRARAGWDSAKPSPSTSMGDFSRWDGSFAKPVMEAPKVASRETTVQSGAYAAARLQLNDAAKLIVGARLSRWEKDIQGSPTILHEDVVTPYLGLVYDLSEQLSAYASYTDIFNPQDSRDRNGKYLDPLVGKSYEAGIKGEFLDRRLNASAALFRTNQDNFAVSDPGFFVPGTDSQTPAMRAARGVRAQGYELELQGELGGGWSIGAGWTQYSARDAQDQDVAREYSRRLLKLFGKHKFVQLPGLSLGAGLTWQSRPPAQSEHPVTKQQTDIGQPAYALLDLMARYELSPQLALQLNIDNLLDKKYYDSSWSGYTYGKPRQFKLTASYKF
ncbi:TonB-dependent siderophore receptor [Roseateles sp. DAIF2]|uniref:TonB-dependent siderophore receptor n=1 Tax=Roseateles sp. DAIF2 TaxID=2714952 RepID=UPI0018A32F51|nr:TonB-dependent siderophore receptor [Roseateles sp. DAIF2]QPF73939.1 TonB-dependent siderophore receptor [Roseateles sp. DAIF2]